MTVKIGKREYRMQNCFAVLLRYLAEFGESYLASKDDAESACLAAVRLVWCAIDGERPDFTWFLAEAARDKSFVVSAHRVRNYIFTPSVQGRRECSCEGGDDRKTDELDVLQLAISAGVPVSLIDRLPVYMLMDLIRRKIDAASGQTENTEYIRATPQNIRELKAMARGR